MTSSWLYNRIAETGFYDAGVVRAWARSPYRRQLARALFNGLPRWWQDDIRAQWEAMRLMEAAE